MELCTRFQKFDGSGRTPRLQQVESLNWLDANWERDVVHCLILPTGSGKAAIGQAIQVAFPDKVTAQVVPSNILIQQHLDAYLGHNFLIGKNRYTCKESGHTCGSWLAVEDHTPCEGCPYKECKDKAKKPEPTIFNAHSAYYLWNGTQNAKSWPDIIVVDEAHLFVNIFRGFGSHDFRAAYWECTVSDCLNDFSFASWATKKLKSLMQLITHLEEDPKEKKALRKANRDLLQLKRVMEGFMDDPQDYAISWQKKEYKGSYEDYMVVECTHAPKWATDVIFSGSKLLLMSATLTVTDIQELVKDRPYEILDLPSPIPKENRKIQYMPVSFHMNYETDPALIVAEIENILDEHFGLNTIIHCTYADNLSYREHFTRYTPLYHNKYDKREVLERFKKEGGILLASGMSEGIDLIDDLARVTIIPRLLRPELMSAIAKKRLGKIGGQLEYDLTTLKNVIQQCGRSTRSASDWSISYILDPSFAKLVEKHKNNLPKAFLEGIMWVSYRKRAIS